MSQDISGQFDDPENMLYSGSESTDGDHDANDQVNVSSDSSESDDVNDQVTVFSDGSESDDADIEDDYSLSTIFKLPAILFKLLWFLLYWQSVFKITETAIKAIMCFLKYFIKLLGVIYQNNDITKLSEQIPLTITTAEKLLGINLQSCGIIEFVVCPKCDSVYSYENCVENRANGTKRAKRCYHIKYPRHPHASKRKPCDAELLKSVVTRKTKSALRPIKTYCYYPLHLSMQRLALRPGFISMCEQWRGREHTIPSNYLGDIYDGDIWKQFRSNFLASPYSYLLSLNVDWFQPFKHLQYSVGAIYLTIQNLPREERFKPENVILVGIIPGPKEPSLTIDSFLQPLIEELKEMFTEGFSVLTPYNTTIQMRLAISCITCDIPATRKVCGFLSHNANLGCNKCYYNFADNKEVFSIFDRSKWK